MRRSGQESRGPAVISIREMSSTDVPAAMAILRESPEAAMWSESILLASRVKGDAWVGTVKGAVSGILISQRAADELEILNLAVEETQRRRGIASQLVIGRTRLAFGEEVRRVYLELRASNSSAFAFYNSLGFQICGRRRGYYRNPVEDAVLMVLHRPHQNY